MCSNSSSSFRTHRIPVLAVLLLAGILGACGHKGPPTPPVRMVPARSTQLVVEQRGREVILTVPFPTTTASGTALDGIQRLEVWGSVQEIPVFALEMIEEERAASEAAAEAAAGGTIDLPEEGAAAAPEDGDEPTEAPSPQEPDPSDDVDQGGESDQIEPEGEGPASEEGPSATDEKGTEEEPSDDEESLVEGAALPVAATKLEDFVQADAREFPKEAVELLVLEQQDLDHAIFGSDIVIRLPLGDLPEEGAEGRVYAVKTFSLRGLDSGFSNLFKIVPLPAPPAPRNIQVESSEIGIRLQWEADEDPEEGFRVYRREARSRFYGPPISTVPPSGREFLDTRAFLGSRYIYAVTSLLQISPVIESATASEHEVNYVDRFGPSPPTQVVGFAETGQVRLLWDASGSADVAGYVVFRRAPDGPLEALTDSLVADLEYLDRTAGSGRVWLYSVVAVDENGNRSTPSTETQVRVP